MLPVIAVDVPQNALISPDSVGPRALRCRESTKRRAHESWGDAGFLPNHIVGSLQLIPHALLAHLRQQRMTPGMTRDLVPLRDDLFGDFRVCGDALADDEERGANPALLEHFQEPWRLHTMRTVVKGDRRILAIYVALADR